MAAAFSASTPPPLARYALALHGGAGRSPAHLTADEQTEHRAALAAILATGQKLLAAGGTALDCVEHVVRLLEDDPHFNAGRGSVLNLAGEQEMDAAIMDGSNGRCGAVAAVRSVRNPITLARRVMTDTGHVLLAGDGAEQFAQQAGVEQAAADYFRTPQRIEQWERARRKADEAGSEQLGTVGCVALDQQGHLAAGTSTGGMLLKQFGRVGDSPLIGAGTYADNATCAVSCTGKGEEFIRYVVAYDVAAQIRYGGRSLAEAAEQVIHTQLQPGDGGLIAIDPLGHVVMPFNAEGMYRAAATSEGHWEIGLGR